MKRPLPCTSAQWLDEIKLAIDDAREDEPFGRLIGQPVTDASLFHLAPLVCLKFRGRKLTGREADRVTKVALANFVVNSDPRSVDHGPKAKPMLAFALCYMTAHLALDLVKTDPQPPRDLRVAHPLGLEPMDVRDRRPADDRQQCLGADAAAPGAGPQERKRAGCVRPSEAFAANALGLPTQVPGRWVYLTNTSSQRGGRTRL